RRHARQPRVARIAARRTREIALDDAVLERMEADDREPAAGREELLGLLERGLERFELPIHGDPDRLRDAGGRMNLRLAAARGTGDDLRELRRRGQRGGVAGANDRGGHRAGARLLAVLAEHARELAVRYAREPLRGGFSPRRVHAHVERPFAGEIGRAAWR